MAALTVATKEAPYDSARKNLGVAVKLVSGQGTDASTVVAAVASTQVHLLGGFIRHNGGAAETLAILSDTTTLTTIELVATAGTIDLTPYRGLYTTAGEGLKLNKSGATNNITSAEFWVVSLTNGQSYPGLE